MDQNSGYVLRMFEKIDLALLCIDYKLCHCLQQSGGCVLEYLDYIQCGPSFGAHMLWAEYGFVDVHYMLRVSASKGQQTDLKAIVQLHIDLLFPWYTLSPGCHLPPEKVCFASLSETHPLLQLIQKLS
jgi:hypothetical protein